jgi:hypothetical protein
MRPFLLRVPWQFRVGPPPSLTSPRYTRDLNEVQAYGSATSTLRTPEQTAVAPFWNAFATNQTNTMITSVVTTHAMDAVDAARSFAIANMVDTDAGIACWDSKYHYQLWRPVTAIQHADIDNNPDTTADTTWTPLLTTPNHPEYPAAHGCLTGAESDLLTAILRTRKIQVDYPGAVGGASTLTTTRHYVTPAICAARSSTHASGPDCTTATRPGRRTTRPRRRQLRPRPLLPTQPPRRRRGLTTGTRCRRARTLAGSALTSQRCRSTPPRRPRWFPFLAIERMCSSPASAT